MARISLVNSRYRPPFFRGGMERYVHVLAGALRRFGQDCSVVALDEPIAYETDIPHTFVAVPKVPFLRPLLFGIAGRHLWRSADLINVQYTPLGVLIPKDKLMCTVHTTGFGEAEALKHSSRKGLWSFWQRVRRLISMPLERFVFSRAQFIIAISAQIAKELVDAYGISHKKIRVIGNGVDCEEFYPSRERKGRKPFRVLYVGRLAPRKNVDLLLRAVAECQIEVDLRVVGTGPELEALQALSASLGLAHKVTFRGFQKGADLLAEYQWADLLVMPSSYEGLPLVALEAKAAGLVIIAANFPGAHDIISRESGWVLDKCTSEALGAAIDESARDSDVLNRMSVRAREEALRDYAWESVMESLFSQYELVLERIRLEAPTGSQRMSSPVESIRK